MSSADYNSDLIIETIEKLFPDECGDIIFILEENDYKILHKCVKCHKAFKKVIEKRINNEKTDQEKIMEKLDMTVGSHDAAIVSLYLNRNERTQHIQTLSSCLNNTKMFGEYARQLLTLAEHADKIGKFQKVTRKMERLLGSESAVRILFYLDSSCSDERREQHIDSLFHNLENDQFFNRYCSENLNTCRDKDNEAKFKAFLESFTKYLKSLVAVNNMLPSACNIGRHEALKCLIGMAMRPETYQAISSFIRMSGVVLCGVYLTADLVKNIHKWKMDGITGKQCAINCLKSMGFMTGGIIGGIAGGRIGGAVGIAAAGLVEGVAMGSVAGPIGMVVGSVAGGIIGSQFGVAMVEMVEMLCEKIFDLPWRQALNDAYTFFKCTSDACCYELNSAYEAVCHNADRAGRALATSYLAVIRSVRERMEPLSIPEQNSLREYLPLIL